jgi:SAM-dependent methyltransferase
LKEQKQMASTNAKTTPRQKQPAPSVRGALAETQEDWNRRYAREEFIWTVDPTKSLMEEVKDLPPGTALDLAAGEGRNAVWLAEKGWTVCAVDFSDRALEKGRQLAEARKVGDKVKFELADLREYAPEAQHFDLVIIMYVQMHAAELTRILTRAAQAVAPGGTFILVGHDSDNLEHGSGGPQDPDLLYTADFVTSVIRGELEIEKAVRVKRPDRNSPDGRTAIDCLVRARRV